MRQRLGELDQIMGRAKTAGRSGNGCDLDEMLSKVRASGLERIAPIGLLGGFAKLVENGTEFGYSLLLEGVWIDLKGDDDLKIHKAKIFLQRYEK